MRSLSLRVATCLLATTAATACVAGDDAADDDDDADVVLGGKADGSLTIAPQEYALMMRISTWYSATELRNKVGLSKHAADAIAAAQIGPDKVRGSRDDAWFRTIEQLDAVPYVGKTALEKMRDYVRTLPEFPASVSERWQLRAGHNFSDVDPQRTGWGRREAFAFDQNDKLVALYMAGEKEINLEIDGARISVPTKEDVYAFAPGALQLAVDGSNTIHVFYARSFGFEHLTYNNGTWTEQPFLANVEGVQVATARNGTFYALTKPRAFYLDGRVQLIRFAADGTSTVENIDDVHSTYDHRSLAVTPDGTPLIAWTNSERWSPYSLWLRRVTAAGPQVTELREPAGWDNALMLSVSGAATPTVFVHGYDARPHLLQDTGSGLAEVATTEDVADEYGMFSAASVDAAGTTTACSSGRTTYSLIEATVDASGAGELHQIISAPEAWSNPRQHFCVPLTDHQGRSHLIFGDESVYVHANVE